MHNAAPASACSHHEGYMKLPNKMLVHTPQGNFAEIPAIRYRKCIVKVSKVSLVGLEILFSCAAQAQTNNPLKSLNGVPVPRPSGAALIEVVKDKATAI